MQFSMCAIFTCTWRAWTLHLFARATRRNAQRDLRAQLRLFRGAKRVRWRRVALEWAYSTLRYLRETVLGNGERCGMTIMMWAAEPPPHHTCANMPVQRTANHYIQLTSCELDWLGIGRWFVCAICIRSVIVYSCLHYDFTDTAIVWKCDRHLWPMVLCVCLLLPMKSRLGILLEFSAESSASRQMHAVMTHFIYFHAYHSYCKNVACSLHALVCANMQNAKGSWVSLSPFVW